jgi:hypothetical protein
MEVTTANRARYFARKKIDLATDKSVTVVVANGHIGRARAKSLRNRTSSKVESRPADRGVEAEVL